MGCCARLWCCCKTGLAAFVVLAVVLLALLDGEELPGDLKSSAVLPAVSMPGLALPSGRRMPMVGLGTAGLGARRMLPFLLGGGRHLDSAEMYRNHGELRRAVRWAGQLGLPREELFIVTKIHGGRFGRERAMRWVEETLREMGLEYLDLVLLHGAAPEPGGDWPVVTENMPCGPPPRCRRETWEVLAGFMAAGKIRDIGVSNFGVRQMNEIMALGVAPIAVNQLEFHPLILEPERRAVAFCHQHGIAVTSYSPFGSGAIINWFSATDDVPVRSIAAAHGKSPGQVLLRWVTQQNVSVIPKSTKPERQRENIDIFDFRLATSEMARIDAVEWRMTVAPNPWDSCDAPDAIWSDGEAGFRERVKRWVDGKASEAKLPVR